MSTPTERRAHGACLVTLAGDRPLEAWFPAPALGAASADLQPLGPGLDREDTLRGVRTEEQVVEIDLDAAPDSVPDAFLRLHLLSHRLVAPHGLNLDGLFGTLVNLAWTTIGPVELHQLTAVRLRARAAGVSFSVTSVDKFPRMTDYVVPSGIRIGDADRVRLGAHLASGTTVMHEGFVNFNAGTLGASMVEGRISAGVVVGDGSDIGGGASIMGTLSGGGTAVISLGEGCLLGANAGLGISLGDGCIVEAGLYLTAGTKVSDAEGTVVKAGELSEASNLLFRRNSQSGAVEVSPRGGGSWGGLNSVLHAND